MASIVQLQKAEENTVGEVNALLAQLSPDYKSISLSELAKMLAHPDIELWVVRDGEHVVGIATLIEVHKLSGSSCLVEHVVVDEGYRGQGLGEALMKKMIERARARGAGAVGLTSRPSRTAANKLYKKLGFVIRETNVYRMEL